MNKLNMKNGNLNILAQTLYIPNEYKSIISSRSCSILLVGRDSR